jgi:tripartite ATP-independent transporter DctP family solute receptor
MMQTRRGTIGLLSGALLAASALAPMPASAQQVLRLATLQGEGQPSFEGLKRLAELVDERSEGELQVEIFGDGQLGTEQESVEGVQFGTIDMFMGSTGSVGRFLPKLEAFAHPYVWRDVDHMLGVVRGEIGDELTEELVASTGIRILDMGWVFGRRHLTTSETEVLTPADMAGLKVRVQPTEIYLATIEGMGGNPTPMDFKEVYTSLQTGVIDGQENPINVIATRALYEVQDYLMLTGHITQNQTVIVNDQVFQSLSPELQEALVSATRDAGDYQNEQLEQKEAEQLELIKANGMKIVEPDVEAFRDATANVHEKFDAAWGEGFFERIKNAGS